MEEFNVMGDFDNPNCIVENTLQRIRRFQTHELNKNRQCCGEYHHLFPTLKKYDDKFKAYTRMTVGIFECIQNKVHDALLKNWCNLYRQSIFPEERLVIVLRFLATGQSYSSLSFSFRMGTSTICELIKETMEVLWNELCPIHMTIPTKKNFLDIATDFDFMWDLPNCIEAIDGRHVRIKRPLESGKLYYNYKNFYSLVLQAVVDAKGKFIPIDVSGYGHQHDATTLPNSSFYEALQNKIIEIPEDDELSNSDIIAPYFFVADGAYPIQKYIMKPYPGKQLPFDQSNFNKKLSRARAVVECSFGRLCQIWRIFYTIIQQSPESADLTVRTACILYNAMIDKATEPATETECNDNKIATVFVQDDTVYRNEYVTGTGQQLRYTLTQYLLEYQ